MNGILLSSSKVLTFHSKKHTSINMSPAIEQLMERKTLQLMEKMMFHTGVPFLNSPKQNTHLGLVSDLGVGGF